MKNIFILFSFLSISGICLAQDYSDPQNMNVNYNREAEYPGGVNQFIADLWSKMEYSQEAIDALADGEIMVSFDVETDSTVTGVSIIFGMDYGINEEFERVLKTMKFIPAIAEGNIVKMNVMLNVPVRVGPNSKKKQK
ncbi:MAG TPA: energy transducer TonB [Bacteroidales bacterium]|nr:energy transducer TonB [Bacteroidales bacterium]